MRNDLKTNKGVRDKALTAWFRAALQHGSLAELSLAMTSSLCRGKDLQLVGGRFDTRRELVKGFIQELFDTWKSRSLVGRSIRAATMFLALSSLASFADFVATWKGFILTGIEFYRGFISEPIGNALAEVLGEKWRNPRLPDLLLFLSLTVGNLLTAELRLYRTLRDSNLTDEDYKLFNEYPNGPTGKDFYFLVVRCTNLALLGALLIPLVVYTPPYDNLVENIFVWAAIALISMSYGLNVGLALNLVKVCRGQEEPSRKAGVDAFRNYALSTIARPVLVLLGIGVLAAINAGLSA